MKRSLIISPISFFAILLLFYFLGCGHSDKSHRLNMSKNEIRKIDLYRAEVAYEISKNWHFDKRHHSNPDDMVSIIFKILPSGEIKDVIMVERSGNNELDKSALCAIKSTSPTKAFPEGIEYPYVEMGLRFKPNGVQ